MAEFSADGVEVNIANGQLKLFNTEGTNSLTPFFTVMRGNGLLNYTSRFAEARGLPGTVLSVEYIQSVVVGYEDKKDRWMTGIMVALSNEPKPRFVGLAAWPPGDKPDYAAASHTVGRVLAEYTGRPLKLFGVKKPPVEGRTVTGPLNPHNRQDIDAFRVQHLAQQVQLPLSEGDAWLGSSKNALTIRLPKESTSKQGRETPAYNQIVIDRDAQQIRLTPPTGLLGSFFGPQGRSIKFQDVRNIEYRHSVFHESSLEKDSDGMVTDVVQKHHEFAVYLTLRDESVMLVQLTHSPAVVSLAAKAGAEKKASQLGLSAEQIAMQLEMAQLRYQSKDGEVEERKANFVESTAVMVAAMMSRPLVKTTVGELVD